MGYDLPERVVKDIVTFAKRYSVRKVILFGSRAKGKIGRASCRERV